MRTRPQLAGVIGVVFAASAAAASTASAQSKVPLAPPGTGADTHLFRPPVDSKGFLSVNGADVVGHLDFSLGLFLDYGHGIMPTAEGRHGPEGDYLLEHSFQGTLQFDLGIANLLVLGISAPIVLAGHRTIEDIGPTGALYTSREGFAQGLGQVALHAKVRILRPLERPSVGLAAILQGGVGVAGAEDLIGENGGFLWPQIAFEGRAAPGGIVRVGVNGGFRANFGGEPARYGVDRDDVPVLEHGVFEYGQLVTTGVAIGARVVDPLEVIAETYSSILVTGENDVAQRVSAEALGGLKVFIDGKSHLFLGGGAGYAPGFQSATARGTVGFVFEPAIGDRDRDGIKDDVDKCPDRAEDIDGFADDDGCPDPDNDEDGVLDIDDACPNTPGDPSPDPNKNGCPALTDSDDDGIPDALDDCPDVAGVKSSEPKRNGCPAEPPIIVGDDRLFVLTNVQFATGSSAILPESNPTLDNLARTLRDHEEITLLEIQGHADERGGERYNLELTQSRAKSVMQALVDRKIDPGRLRSMGFGFYCPKDERRDADAWRENRRVEFKIVRKNGDPTGVELGCERAKAKGVESPAP